MRLFRITLWTLIGIGAVVSVPIELATIALAPLAGLASLIIAALVAPLAALVWRRSPMWPPGPRRWAVASMAWGATVAVALAMPIGAPLNTLTGYGPWPESSASWTGAYPEEFGKALGVFVVMLSFRELTRPWHGFIVGALVGWGFEVYENFLYGGAGAMLHPSSDALGLLQMWGMRLAIGFGLHMFFTGLVGCGLGWALLSANRSGWWRFLVGSGSLAGGFCLHFAWNYAWPLDWMAYTNMIVVGIVLYSVSLVVIVRNNRLARQDTTYARLTYA